VNINDLFILLGLIVFTAVGFSQGTIRVVVSIFSFYLALVLASLYYRIVGVFLMNRLDTSPTAAPAVGFGLVLLFSFIVLVAALLYTFRYAQVPNSLQILDRTIGAVLGLVLGGLIMGMYAVVMRYIFIDHNLTAEVTWPVARAFQSSVRSSFMIQFFLSDVLPLILNTLDPVLPDEANVIFNIQR
jgi:membrane protein required for colicin V production